MEIDWEIVDSHRQIYENSCIPSAIEMILKLLGKVDSNYYIQQYLWENKIGSFADFDGKIIEGVTFKLINGKTMDGLFVDIDQQLKASNFVIISLKSSLIDKKEPANLYHMYVIFDYCEKDYRAFTKIRQDTKCIANVREIVKAMGTTDILIYS